MKFITILSFLIVSGCSLLSESTIKKPQVDLTKVSVNGKKLLTQIIDEKTQVKAQSISSVKLPITINYNDFYGSLQSLIGKKKSDYTLSGSVKIARFFTLPFEEKGEFSFSGGKLQHARK